MTIELDSGEVTATAYHPFWVIQGLDLDNRPPVSHLLPNEDRGQSLPGRWVNSHELMERDIVFIRAGGPTSIRRVAHRQVNMSVCNLTIRGLHTFCVGTTQVLVHNESGTVGPINPGGAAPNTNQPPSSTYRDVTGPGSLPNRATNATKPSFEKNLVDQGFTRSVSKDGKVTILQKDGAKYILRDGAKSTGGPTADFYKPGSKNIDLKIRLEDTTP